MSEAVEPPKVQPVHRVEVEPGHGPTFEVQAREFDGLSENPYIDVTYRLADQGEAEVSLTARYGLSLAEVDALIGALAAARAEAVAEAELYGWSEDEGAVGG
ncbi:hypothetical protein GCM10011608_10350 [Micromonospora sonchi]|uniref:Uncharacterized protein n=1 Tax=Micromonospora sonchi TaxID=1763543 RepID=A0A917TNK7_9ACTN|nr:hypothetical protein [Micromonospora sonchi]GGM27501.1 hypothetical protein GCM10011608_10350 [Micromonospora sonchi]